MKKKKNQGAPTCSDRYYWPGLANVTNIIILLIPETLVHYEKIQCAPMRSDRFYWPGLRQHNQVAKLNTRNGSKTLRFQIQIYAVIFLEENPLHDAFRCRMWCKWIRHRAFCLWVLGGSSFKFKYYATNWIIKMTMSICLSFMIKMGENQQNPTAQLIRNQFEKFL